MSQTIHHRDTETQRDPLTDSVIGAAIEVHRALGAGLLESAYEECLCHELECRNLEFARQVALPVRYKAISLDCAYRMDVVVENRLILELSRGQTFTHPRCPIADLPHVERFKNRPADELQCPRPQGWTEKDDAMTPFFSVSLCLCGGGFSCY